MKKSLYKLSHFVYAHRNSIVLPVITETEYIHESLKRALFLADVEYVEFIRDKIIPIKNKLEKIQSYTLNIKFTRYNQLRYIIPIINKQMIKLGITTKEYDFYYIDKTCKEFFNG